VREAFDMFDGYLLSGYLTLGANDGSISTCSKHNVQFVIWHNRGPNIWKLQLFESFYVFEISWQDNWCKESILFWREKLVLVSGHKHYVGGEFLGRFSNRFTDTGKAERLSTLDSSPFRCCFLILN
jgi:hypothetical protein